jgi:hypothetical protein
VGALVVGAFIVGSEILESFVPVSGTLLNVLVAVSILIVLRPIQLLALKITSGLMRNVEDTPEYLEVRRHEVYRAALEGAIQDGVITEKERSILDHLSDSLGISRDEAALMEDNLKH